eukprot:scaffold2242_cov370-Prasinococcus_capsulatus_cf.AAC.3
MNEQRPNRQSEGATSSPTRWQEDCTELSRSVQQAAIDQSQCIEMHVTWLPQNVADISSLAQQGHRKPLLSHPIPPWVAMPRVFPPPIAADQPMHSVKCALL